MSEAESDSVDRCATNANPDGTADQGELERLAASVRSVQREEAAVQLPKAAQLASVPRLGTLGDGIWPPHSLEPDYLARRDALRGPRTMIKMSFLIVGILSVPMAYYFWMGGWDTIPGASPPELASFNSKPIIPPPESSSEEETAIARGGDAGTRVQGEPRGAKSFAGKAIAMFQPGMPEARDPHSSTAARALDLPKPPSQQKTAVARDDSPRTPGQTEPLTPKSSAGDTVRGAIERAPTVRGVTDNEIRLGISAPFTGSAKELGNQMKLGIQTAFNLINDSGGIDGRQLRLVAADDGYEPTRTAETMQELYEKEQVFGFIGNVGTPTAVVGLPYALERKMLFFGAFTGAGLLRRDPPDRYVFNYRASYAEETDAVVRYLVKVRRLRPEQIAVFAQQDAYGDSGFAGVAKAMRALRGGNEGAILRLDYKRNTVDVDDAVARLRAHKPPIKAVVMVPTYRAAAKFIEKTRDLYPAMIYTNVSFVGSTALADELMLLGPRYANGVIVTQVVPAVDSYASTILKYKTALAKYFPGVPPDYVSLEGYVAGSLLLEGLKRAGPQLDTEELVEALETVRDFDMGLGAPISFGPTEHQGSHKVWGTQLNENGRYQAIDLE
jgi:branched-chain amino acid transport system substrate-binding protein